ncbi:MAG: (d)CMP kinase [Proteobacteria bacterium]|nr:(d)CMP kinase [Pseudomonadota bacterium]
MIAVDGPAASGKGTLARRLAEHFGFHWLDTGLLYRAVAARVPDGAPDQAIAVARTFDAAWLADAALRGEASGRRASQVSAIPEVRAALLAYQRDFARQAPGAVLDGRDIGTVVCPDADAKLFVTAKVEVRAARRLKELRDAGTQTIYAAVLQDLIERDRRDTERAAAPLKAAADALMLDTSGLDADQAFAAALALIGPQMI